MLSTLLATEDVPLSVNNPRVNCELTFVTSHFHVALFTSDEFGHLVFASFFFW